MKKITIEGMSCGHCVVRVEKALKDVCGVKSVEVNLKDRLATVDFAHEVDNSKLHDAINSVGYKVIEIK